MELERVRVRNYKSIQDTGWVDIENVTCFIGKNESGKTAFLEAINKLNPIRESGDYDPLMEYPRKDYRHYENYVHDEDPAPVASATYSLSPEDEEVLANHFGSDILRNSEVTVTKDYKNDYHWELDIHEPNLIKNILDRYDLHHSTQNMLGEAENLNEFKRKLRQSDAQIAPQLMREVESEDGEGISDMIGDDILFDRMPNFLYFNEYSTMEGDVNINDIIKRERDHELTRRDATFISLVSMAGLDLGDLRSEEEYERIKVEMEAVSLQITNEIFEYWSQGSNLQVEFDDERKETVEIVEDPESGEVDTTETTEVILHIRVKNPETGASIRFNERSRGFIWFFSFLAYFSQYERSEQNLTLLLDEPGLNLHAKAQSDLLEFINDRLAPNQQVIYTTHSPFMLEPRKLHRAKLVEFEDVDEGTTVSEDILGTNEETVFPLQAALGFDLIHTLLIGPECLLVEGKSDMTYIQVMSDILSEEERTDLSHRWTIVPVDGADNAPTFVSLFGANDIDIAILLDDEGPIDQRLEDLEGRGLIDRGDIQLITEYTSDDPADTEDMFDSELYLELVNSAYLYDIRANEDVDHPISLDDLPDGNPRIVKKLDLFFERWHINEGEFEHTKPATTFQKHRDEFAAKIDEETKDRFEALFEDLNSMLG